MRGVPIGDRSVALATLVLVSAVSVVSMVGTSVADDVKYVYVVRDQYAHRAKTIDAPPVEKLFDEEQLEKYKYYMSENKCSNALFMIRKSLDNISHISKAMSDITMEWHYSIA